MQAAAARSQSLKNVVINHSEIARSFSSAILSLSGQVTSEGFLATRVGRETIDYSNRIERIVLTQRLAAEEMLRERQEKLFKYLTSLAGKSRIRAEHLFQYWNAWQELVRVAGSGIQVPDACPGEEGQLQFNLDAEDHHLELELFPTGKVELFYRDRKTGLIWSDEYVAGTLEKDPSLSQKISNVFRSFRLF